MWQTQALEPASEVYSSFLECLGAGEAKVCQERRLPESLPALLPRALPPLVRGPIGEESKRVTAEYGMSACACLLPPLIKANRCEWLLASSAEGSAQQPLSVLLSVLLHHGPADGGSRRMLWGRHAAPHGANAPPSVSWKQVTDLMSLLGINSAFF